MFAVKKTLQIWQLVGIYLHSIWVQKVIGNKVLLSCVLGGSSGRSLETVPDLMFQMMKSDWQGNQLGLLICVPISLKLKLVRI